MSDFRTLRDALEAYAVRIGTPPEEWGNLLLPDALLDLRIVDNALVALDVEAGQDALFAVIKKSRDGNGLLDMAEAVTAILQACGVHVPDEVVEGVYEEIAYEQGTLNGPNGMYAYIEDRLVHGQHYTITITKRKEAE